MPKVGILEREELQGEFFTICGIYPPYAQKLYVDAAGPGFSKFEPVVRVDQDDDFDLFGAAYSVVITRYPAENLMYPHRLNITPELALEVFAQMTEITPLLLEFYSLVFYNGRFPWTWTPQEINQTYLGANAVPLSASRRYVLGLLAVAITAKKCGINTLWSRPDNVLCSEQINGLEIVAHKFNTTDF